MKSKVIIFFLGGLLGFVIGRKTAPTGFEEEATDYSEEVVEAVKTDPTASESVSETFEDIRREYDLVTDLDVEENDKEEIIFETSGKIGDIREITKGEWETTFEDSQFMYFRFVKETCELYDDRNEYVPHPRIFLGDIWDGLESNTVWPMYVRNDDMDMVFEIDRVD